jgi:hypothetical protein
MSPAVGASFVAPLALALPENVAAIDAALVNNLCQAVNALTTEVAKISTGMDVVTAEVRAQKQQVQAIVHQLEQQNLATAQKMAVFEEDMAAMNKDINEKLAAMTKKVDNEDVDARLAKLAADSASPPTSASAAAAASLAASSAPAGAVVGGGLRPAHRPTRLWLKGFGETLTTKALLDFTNKALDRLPAQHRLGARAGTPGFGAVAFVDFPTTAAISSIKLLMTEMQLKHVDGEGRSKDIRITNDVPLPVRYKAKVLGELWHRVKDHVLSLPHKDQPSPLQLSNNNGKLYMIHGPRPIELFSTKIDNDGGIHVTASDQNLMKYQISPKLYDAWVADAVASASRFAAK